MNETFNVTSLVSKLEIRLKELLREKKEFIKNISKLENLIRKEKLKNNILSFLLKEKTDLDISKLFNETETELTIQDSFKGEISIIVHNEFKDETVTYEIKNQNKVVEESVSEKEDEKEKEDNKPKQIFRAVKKAENAETIEETEEKIKKADEVFSAYNNYTDVSIKDTLLIIDSVFNSISKNRIHKKELETLKVTRFKLLGKMNLEAYTNLVTCHIQKLKDVFNSKKYDSKKISDLIHKSLNNLDQRLVFFEQYYNTSLLPEELEKLKVSLIIHMDYLKRYTSFHLEDTYKKFLNYGMVVFTLKENLLRIFNNPYNFHNIIYLNLDKSTQDDPYSFYYLEKINPDGKRFWKMDCRLEDLSKNIGIKLKIYCINLYRKIYFNVFQDNIYRSDFFEKAVLFKEDLEQLFQNLIKITKKKEFCLMLQFVIKNYGTITPTIQDKFNLTSDDKVNKKNFSQEVDTKDDIIEIIKEVFDGISKENAEELYENKCQF